MEKASWNLIRFLWSNSFFGWDDFKISKFNFITNKKNQQKISIKWNYYFVGVTILLSLTVFLNLVAETLPQVSDAIPLLGSDA